MEPSGPVKACNGIDFALLKLEQRTTIYDKHASIFHAVIYCKNKITVMSNNDEILIKKSLYEA
jgi:hypothetical protein